MALAEELDAANNTANPSAPNRFMLVAIFFRFFGSVQI